MTVIESTVFSEVPKGESVISLFFGSTGSGKTDLAGTANDNNEGLLYLDLAGGHVTLQSNAYIARHPNVNSMHYIPIREEVDQHGVVKTAVMIDNLAETTEEWFDKKLDRFKTVVVDDLTAFSFGAQYKAMELAGRLMGSSSLTKAKVGKHFPIKEKSDWGVEITAIKSYFGALIDECQKHQKHLIVLAHQRKYFIKAKGDQEPILNMVGPLLAGKDSFAPEQYPAMFDLVWHFSGVASNGKLMTKIRTMPNAIYPMVHTRASGVFKEVEERMNDSLTFPKIVERIKAA